jgi:hypothetical protein
MSLSNIMVAVLLAASVSVVPAAIDNGTIHIDDGTVRSYANIYNHLINNAPQFVKGLIGNATIDLNITMSNGKMHHTGFEMENAWISRIVEGGISDPSISVNATEDAVNRVLCSNDPMTVFNQEMNSGDISIKMHDANGKVKGCPFI